MDQGTLAVRRSGLTVPAGLRMGVLLLSAVIVCAAAATIKVIPYGRAFWDFLFVMDGAYRIRLGQTPHIDFIAPIGSLTLYLTAWGERLFPGGQPFVGLHALMWLFWLPPLAMLAPRFQTGMRFCAAFALLALIVLIPYTLDKTSLSEISYFATYNRFVVGGLFLVGLWYVLPKSAWDAPLLGYLVGLLLLLKITAAAVAVGLLVAACILGRARWRPVIIGLAGLAVVCLAVEAASGFLSAYLRDVMFMVRINEGQGLNALVVAAVRNWAPLAIAGGMILLAIADVRRGRAVLSRASGGPRRSLQSQAFVVLQSQAFVIDAVLLLGAALAAESQNTGGIGLVAASAVLFHPDITPRGSWRPVAAILLGTSLLLPLLDGMVSRTATAYYHARGGASFSALSPGIRIPSYTLAGAELFRRLSHEWLPLISDVQVKRFNVDNDPSSNAPAAGVAWSEDVVDAAKVFREKGLESSAHSYAVIAFTDPFSELLGLTPARGVTLAVQVGRTIPVFTPPEASRYLAKADGLFVSECALSAGGEETIRSVFRPVLAAEFERVPLNACWDFYRRTQSSPPAPTPGKAPLQ